MSVPDPMLLYLLTAAMTVATSVGAYWARGVDKRLEVVESELAEEKLLTTGKLAKVEALLERMSKQLDLIEEEFRERNSNSRR